MPASGIRDGSRHKSEMSCLVSSRGWEPGPAELAEAAAAVQLVALVRQELRSRPAGATLQVDSLYDSDSKQSSTTFEKLWFFGRRINVTTLKKQSFFRAWPLSHVTLCDRRCATDITASGRRSPHGPLPSTA